MAKKRTAFSLVELIIIVMWVGILAAIAVPRLNFAIISKQKAEALTGKIITDLRLTRRLAISDAANNTIGFELKMVGSAPYAAYEIENCDTLETVASHTIYSGVNVKCPGGSESRFSFGPLGNLQAGSGTKLNVSAEGRSFKITVNPATGTVICVEN